MVAKLNPLTWNRPIADKDGKPSREFQIKWEQLYRLASTIPSLSTPAAVSAVLDILTGDEGDLLVRGAALWEGLASPNDGTLFLSGTLPPTWATPPSGTLVTTGNPGIVPALSGDASEYFDGSGSYSVPVGTTYAVVTTILAGLAPVLSGDNTEYLDGDGNWTVPAGGTTYTLATTLAIGLAPILSGDSDDYLDGNGNYTVPVGTTYGVVTAFLAGLAPVLPADDTLYLDGDGNWSTPAGTGPTYSLATTGAIGLAPILSGDPTDYLDGDGNYSPIPLVTITNDGLAPTLSGDAGEYLDGDGNWTVPAGSVAGVGPDGQYITFPEAYGFQGSATLFATKGLTFTALADITVHTVFAPIQNNTPTTNTYKPLVAIMSGFSGSPTITSMEDGPAVTAHNVGYNEWIRLPLDNPFDINNGDVFMIGATNTFVAGAANPLILLFNGIGNAPGPFVQRLLARLASNAPAPGNAIDTNGNSVNAHPMGFGYTFR